MQRGQDVAVATDGDAWSGSGRRPRRWPWLTGITAVLAIAGLLAYHVVAGNRLAPVTYEQVTDPYAELNGTWTSDDGVVFEFDDTAVAGDFEYSYTANPLYRMPGWVAPFGLGTGQGTWSITALPGSGDAVIELTLSIESAASKPGPMVVTPGPSIVLSLLGDPARPTLACQHPTAGDTCRLTWSE